MALKDLFKPGAFLGKGGTGSGILAGLANTAVNKLSGGTISNLFKLTPPKDVEEARKQANAQAGLAAIGSATGTFQALYQPSAQQVVAQQASINDPFSGQNVEKKMNSAGTKSFLVQWWYVIAGVILIPFAFLLLKRK
jgi:hypothetical protein